MGGGFTGRALAGDKTQDSIVLGRQVLGFFSSPRMLLKEQLIVCKKT